jgi:TRAP-type mannitol/chloroaromatic compound transport system substrate-binding protein
MMVVTVWHGRDAYDYTLSPMLHQTFKTLSDEALKDMITQHDKYVKGGQLPWYLITVTRFEVGVEPTSETYHRANPAKTKIVLNARAKPDPKKKKVIEATLAGGNAANLWAQIHEMQAFAPVVEAINVPQPDPNW